MSPLFWTGVGVTGLGVLVGSITGGLSLSAASEAKEGCVDTRCVRAPDGSNEDAADRSVLMGHVSTAGFAVAGAGAALAIVGLVVSTGGDDDEPAAATFQPLAGPGFIGVRGSF